MEAGQGHTWSSTEGPGRPAPTQLAWVWCQRGCHACPPPVRPQGRVEPGPCVRLHFTEQDLFWGKPRMPGPQGYKWQKCPTCPLRCSKGEVRG